MLLTNIMDLHSSIEFIHIIYYALNKSLKNLQTASVQKNLPFQFYTINIILI